MPYRKRKKLIFMISKLILRVKYNDYKSQVNLEIIRKQLL